MINYVQSFFLNNQPSTCVLSCLPPPPPLFLQNRQVLSHFLTIFFIKKAKLIGYFAFVKFFKSKRMDALFWHDLVEQCILHFAFIKKIGLLGTEMQDKNPKKIKKFGFLKACRLKQRQSALFQTDNGTKCPRFQPAADFHNINMIKDIKNDKK